MSDQNVCTPEEKQIRIDICGTCIFNILDIIPKCQQSGIALSNLIEIKTETCPEGKW